VLVRRYAALRPRFVTEEGFISRVILPNNSPVRSIEIVAHLI